MDINDVDLPGQLERHFKNAQHRLVDKLSYRGIDVYISEGGPFHVKDRENPLGFYEAAYVIRTQGVLFYQPLRFDFLHDIQDRSDQTRRLGRINAAVAAAKSHVDEFIKAHAH